MRELSIEEGELVGGGVGPVGGVNWRDFRRGCLRG